MTSAERNTLFDEQCAIHHDFRRDSIRITDPAELRMPIYPWTPRPYYMLLYRQLLEKSGQKTVSALTAELAHKLSTNVLDELGVGNTDERLNDWLRECENTSKTRCGTNEKLKHARRYRREDVDFTRSPNAEYYDHVDPMLTPESENELSFCTCAAEDTIMLCNNLSHIHCAEMKRSLFREPKNTDAFRDRLLSGRYNQNVVAVGTFGNRGSRDRWMRLRSCIAKLMAPVHGCSLCNELDEAFAKRYEVKNKSASLAGLVCCLASFTYASYKEQIHGKRGDRDFSLLPHTKYRLILSGSITPYSQTVRDAEYLDVSHPHHSRVDARNATELTLGLLLFLEATESTTWSQAWKLWCRILEAHCRTCVTNCRASLAESLSFVVMCAALMPPTDRMSHSFSHRVEILLQLLLPKQ